MKQKRNRGDTRSGEFYDSSISNLPEQQFVANRTQLLNQTRGLLGEYGILLPLGEASQIPWITFANPPDHKFL